MYNTLNYFYYRQMKFPLVIITVSVVALKLCSSSDLELVPVPNDPDLGSQQSEYGKSQMYILCVFYHP